MDTSPASIGFASPMIQKDVSDVLDCLQRETGLHFDPFQHLDAGSDPYLHRYLVDDEAFPLLWKEQPAFLFAPPGGGKSAFRVRLAAACRAEYEGRRFFPISFLLPAPETLTEEILLSRAAAGELLFHLAYRSYRFPRLKRPLQRELKTILTENLPAPLEYYLDQLEETGNLSPLAEAFDPTARDLPIEPLPETLRSFCQMMRTRRRIRRAPLPPQERFESMIRVLLENLHFEAIFLLVDGADAYVTRPEAVLSLLRPLLRRTLEWAERRIFAKYFLPVEIQSLIEKEFPDLTALVPKVTIEWTRERLTRVLEERLRVASRGMFTSFRGMGTVGLPVDPEAYLAAQVSPPLPREVVYLAKLILDEHRRRVGSSGWIEPADLERAIARYRKEKKGSMGHPRPQSGFEFPCPRCSRNLPGS